MQTIEQTTNQVPRPRKRRRFLLISGATLVIVGASATVASAFGLGTISNVLDRSQQLSPVLQKVGISSSDLNQAQQYIQQGQQYVSQAQQYWNQVSSIYRNIIHGNLMGILGDVQTVTGALGIPDPLATRSQTASKATTPAGTAGAQATADKTDTAVAAGVASTVLSQEGQAMLKTQQERAGIVVAQGGQIATQTQFKTATQDVGKDMVALQALQSQIEGHQSNQLMGLQIQGAASNLMLSGMNGTLNHQQLQKQQEQRAADRAQSQAEAQLFLPGVD